MTQTHSTLTIITESLPSFTVGKPARLEIEVSGGTPPYHFKIKPRTLPSGLHLSDTGTISGTPKEAANTNILIKVTDKKGAHVSQAFNAQVSAAARAGR